MAFQDQWAKPLADSLVDLYRVDGLQYVKIRQGYDPSTGDVSITRQMYDAAGAVTKKMVTNEGGGVQQVQAIEVWINSARIGEMWPTTLDLIRYEGSDWKIVEINPQFSGDTRYACKVIARMS
jgi:hypothetical protein